MLSPRARWTIGRQSPCQVLVLSVQSSVAHGWLVAGYGAACDGATYLVKLRRAAPPANSRRASRSTPAAVVRSLIPTTTAPLPTTRMSPPSVVMHKGKLQRSWPQLPSDILGCALPRRWFTA